MERERGRREMSWGLSEKEKEQERQDRQGVRK